MAFPPLIYDAAVTFELLAYSWPVGELVSIGEATIGEPDDGVLTQGKLYRLAVRVELPDADDDLLVERARRVARALRVLRSSGRRCGCRYRVHAA